MCFKSYFKEIVLKLATNGQNDKGFLLTSTFVPKGLSAPALGLYTYQDQVSDERLQDHWSSGFTSKEDNLRISLIQTSLIVSDYRMQ